MDINAYRLLYNTAIVSKCGSLWPNISIPYYGILLIFKLSNYEATPNIGFNPALMIIEELISYGYNNSIAWALNPLKTS